MPDPTSSPEVSAGCGCQYDAAGRVHVDHCVCPTPTPASLAEAEQAVRALAERTDWWVASQITAEALRLVLAEYDRRGAVEQAAADYVRTGLCGSYEIPGGRGLQQNALSALIAAVRTNGAFDA